MSSDDSRHMAGGIDKMPTGIAGFDEITLGGLPRRRLTLVLGAAGSGKTVFALQTLVNGARHAGEPGIFVAFEEHSRQIVENAATFGWDLPQLERDKLFFLDARLSPDTVHTGDFDLLGMLATLKAKAEDMGAKRIVFDSLDVLLSFLNDPLIERQEIYRVRDWLADTDLTGIITSRVQFGSAPSREFVHFISDSVVLLEQHVVEQVAARKMRILKYRGSDHTPNEFPLDIGQDGIEVVGISPARHRPAALDERVSTGIDRLDTMLDGGYYRDNSVLITGAPGTAKTSLTGAFVDAACRRGERALYVCFDEMDSEIVRNLTSIGVHLQPHLDSSRLRFYSGDTFANNSVRHVVNIRKLVHDFKPHCLVIDPLSALIKVSELPAAQRMAQWLLQMAKSNGITTVCTSLLEGSDAEAESTAMQVSTIADVWMHLSYVVRGGERNRALTIIKARGTGHSNQVRELLLQDDGITLADVYAASGEVFMGTLRQEQEQADVVEKQRVRDEVERRRLELQIAETEASYRLDALQRELAMKRAALEQLERDQGAQEQHWHLSHEDRLKQRGADARSADDDSDMVAGTESEPDTTEQ